jgi:hypothetical protein
MKGNRSSAAGMAEGKGKVLPLIRTAAKDEEPQAAYVIIDTRLLAIMKHDLERAMETLNIMLDVTGSPAGQRGC